MSRLASLLPVALLTLLSACATGPTKILLDPEVIAAGSSLGSGQTVQLQVSSLPSSAATGQPHFDLERPVTVTVKEKLAGGLAAHHFQVSDASAERQFVVTIQKAEHQISHTVLRDTIAVETVIEFKAITPAGTRSRTFNDKRSREVGGTASLGEVSGEMNQSLGHVLARALNDAELIAFLGQ
ncbi:hypothetical protein HPT27_16045 [Permianibacter sp. IMCC34836]|uniref:YajG family lipoprotein n=1 Tax=Permianibacter fluminis TaxID=2738515 RepID=UPI001551B486|nr:YajG family lipoprotein [Permianibacter fluminis]NQD38535.1 hypothetical protein [Permianibacter fluminis]